MIGEGIPDLLRGADGALRWTLALLTLACVAYLLAWWRPRAGGALLGLAGGGLGLNVLLQSGLRDVRFALIFALPFLLPSLLFLAAARLQRR